MKAKGYRRTIREFMKSVEWVNPRNVAILIRGVSNGNYHWADTELWEMERATQIEPDEKIKRLYNEHHHIFATIGSKKKDKGTTNLEHDIKLRDVLAKYLYDRSWEGITGVSVKRIPGNPDAHLGSIYFELDTGHEEDAELTKKLVRYSGSGAFQVVFIMAHRFGVKELEKKRLEKIMNLGNKVLGHKPNRILAATYHGFLENGHLVNLKGERRDT